jgi:hypothetical protein
MSKPNHNPGKNIMAERFKPRLSDARVKASSTTMLVANVQKYQQKLQNIRKVAVQKWQLERKRHEVAQ